MLMEELIWDNKFTEGSAIQIKYDLLHGLFSIFTDFGMKPTALFKNLSCVLRIWEMSSGDAMLLYETLHDTDVSYEEQADALLEAQVSSMTLSEVLKLLKTRIEFK